MPILTQRPKLLLKVFAVLLAGVFVLALATLRPVDYTPYFTTDYYRHTRARWEQLAAAQRAAIPQPLFAGFGRAALTPQLHSAERTPGHFSQLPMAGYGRRGGRPALGVHDSLFATAVALRAGESEVVLVNLDALIVSRAMSEGVIARVDSMLGLRREQVLFGATHTHSGLGGWGEGVLAELFAGKYEPRALEWIITQMVTAIARAHADLSPARFASSAFAAPHHVMNRLVGDNGGVDDQFRFLVLRQAEGDPILIGAFAAHATVLSAQNMLFSADYCGYWRAALETKTHGRALFFAGGVGSHGPLFEGEEFAAAKSFGESLADSVLMRLPQLQYKTECTLRALGLRVDLPELHLRVSDGLRLAPWLARQLVYERDTYLQIVAWEDLLWLGAPCDISGEMSANLKDFAARRGMQALVTSFNGSYVGYVIPSRYYHFDAYESRRMSFFGPYMGDYFEEMMQRMMVTMAVPR